MKHWKIFAATSLLACASPAIAQDDADTVTAIFTALGQLGGTGEASFGTGAGENAGAMLSALALERAALAINQTVTGDSNPSAGADDPVTAIQNARMSTASAASVDEGNGPRGYAPILILADDEGSTSPFAQLARFSAEVADLKRGFYRLISGSAGAPPGDSELLESCNGYQMQTAIGIPPRGLFETLTETAGTASDAAGDDGPSPLSAIVPGLLNALAVDTTIRGFSGVGNTRMLASMLAGMRAGNESVYILPGPTVTSSANADNNPVNGQLSLLASCREAVGREYARLDPGNDAQKRRRAVIKAVTDRHDAFLTRINTASSKGVPPIAAIYAQSALYEQLMPEGAQQGQILRLRVERAGGALVSRRNIWTTLGADSASISGSVIVNFTLSTHSDANPVGEINRSGLMLCGTGLHSLRASQRAPTVRHIQSLAPSCVGLINGRRVPFAALTNSR